MFCTWYGRCQENKLALDEIGLEIAKIHIKDEKTLFEQEWIASAFIISTETAELLNAKYDRQQVRTEERLWNKFLFFSKILLNNGCWP